MSMSKEKYDRMNVERSLLSTYISKICYNNKPNVCVALCKALEIVYENFARDTKIRYLNIIEDRLDVLFEEWKESELIEHPSILALYVNDVIISRYTGDSEYTLYDVILNYKFKLLNDYVFKQNNYISHFNVNIRVICL